MTLLRSPVRAPHRSPLYNPLEGKWGGGPFTPADLSPLLWYDPSDLSTLFQDSAGTTPVTADGDPVGMMRDKSGNGHHLTQATASARPVYKTDGTLHWLLGDGVDDWMSVAFTAISQPWGRVSALRQVTWTSGDRIYGGGPIVNAGLLAQSGSSPSIALYDGTGFAPATAGLAVGSDGVVTERHSGATSRIAVNNDAYTTGSPGTQAPDGFALFNRGSGTYLGANALSYGLVQWTGTRTDEQIALARTWAGAKAGLSL